LSAPSVNAIQRESAGHGDVPAFDVDDADVVRLVDERDLAAVGGPIEPVAEPPAPLGHLPRLTHPVAGLQVDLVLTGAITPVRHLRAVGRPSRIAIERAARTGHIHHIAVRDRHVEELATGLEDHALALGRGGHVADAPADVDRARHLDRQVAHYLHRDLAVGVARGVHDVEPTAGLEDHLPGSGRHERDVEVLEVGDLCRRAGRHVVRPQIEPHVRALIGDEVDPVAHPGGLSVVRGILRDVLRGIALEVVDDDVRREPAPVPLERVVLRDLRDVGEARPVGRVARELAVRHRELLGQPPLLRHEVELAERLSTALSRRGEEQALPVRVPVDHPVTVRLVRDARRHSARGGHDVDVLVAAVARRERDLRPVR
jgi:hypothetical protein